MALLRGVSDTWLQFDWHFCRSGPEHLFMCFMDIWVPSLKKCPFRFLPVFLLGWLFFWSWAVGGFACDSAGKESACNAGDLGLIPGLGRSPGEGKGYLLQYSGLENSMGCTVHGSQRVGHNWATFTFTVWALCIFGDEFLVFHFGCKHLFSHSDGCLCLSFRVALPVQNLFRLMKCLLKKII